MGLKVSRYRILLGESVFNPQQMRMEAVRQETTAAVTAICMAYMYAHKLNWLSIVMLRSLRFNNE